MERPKSHGLKRRGRASGEAWYWFASKAAIEAGYPVKAVNLTSFADRPKMMVERAERLQEEMNLWMRRGEMPVKQFDGSFKFLLETYQSSPKSPFNTDLKPGVRRSYTVYLKKLIYTIGHLLVDKSNGEHVMDWFVDWRVGPKTKKHPDGKDQLPAARMTLAVIEAAVSFGIIMRFEGVKAFQDVLGELEFPRPRSRKHAPTAKQIIAARKAAHENGKPSRALVYALQYETTARQWDWIGNWVEVAHPALSNITDRGSKWLGVKWSDINKDMIVTIKPTKTEDTTEVEISYDLSVCPMVMEELERVPENMRVGPLVINEGTRLPYRPNAFYEGWREDYKLAGIPEEIWNRDTRAAGITEGRLSGANQDDRRRLAGHANADQTDDYERGTVDIEAHRNVMKARVPFRQKNSQ